MIPVHFPIVTLRKKPTRDFEPLRDYLCRNPFVRRFSDVFLFKHALILDQYTDGFYPDGVKRQDLHIKLFSGDCMLINQLGSCLQEYRLMNDARVVIGISILGGATT